MVMKMKADGFKVTLRGFKYYVESNIFDERRFTAGGDFISVCG